MAAGGSGCLLRRGGCRPRRGGYLLPSWWLSSPSWWLFLALSLAHACMRSCCSCVFVQLSKEALATRLFPLVACERPDEAVQITDLLKDRLVSE